MSHDPDHAPFRDDLISAGWDLLPLTYRRNLKFLTTPVMKMWEPVQNVQIGIVGALKGHSRSSAMSLLDRAHATSYSTLKSASVLYRFRDIASYLSTHLTCIWCPCRGLSQWNFEDIFGVRKLESLGCLCCLFDPKFSCFGRTPTCDRHRHRAIAYTALA